MIILLGMAGSCKGTQGREIAKALGWRHISVGEVIRNSHQYDSVITRGELIPDEDVVQMMHREIRKAVDAGKEVILDGYPRDTIQTEYITQRYPGELKAAIIIEVPKEELYVRLALRGRADDKSKESIEKRFEVFEENIQPMLATLEAAGTKVRRVNGDGDPEEVTRRILSILNELNLVGSREGEEAEVLRAREEAESEAMQDESGVRAENEAARDVEAAEWVQTEAADKSAEEAND